MRSKKLWLRDKLLLGIALLGDIFEEFQDPGGFVSFSYKQMYGFTPAKYKKHNFYVLVSRLLKANQISKTVRCGEVYLTLTNHKGILVERFPLIKLRDKWDGKFRVVIFDIEEVNKRRRDFLRNKLKELGFGMWQRSVWVSPLPIEKEFKEFLKEQKLLTAVHILTIPKEDCGNLHMFADKIWKIEEVNKAYKEWIKALKEKIRNKGRAYKQLKEQFWEILLKDPFLPRIFLPEDWAGEKALDLFKETTVI